MVVISVFGEEEDRTDEVIDHDDEKRRLEAIHEIAKRAPALDLVLITPSPNRRPPSK